MEKYSCSSTYTSVALSSFVGLTRRWRRRVAVASRRWGKRGWGARWSGGKLLIARRTTLLLTGRGRRGLVTAMEIEGVKGRQSLRQGERKRGVTTGFHQNYIRR